MIRFASFLRGLGARSQSGINDIHYLDSADNGLGQSPLLAPSVFNFYSPNFRQPGAVARAGLYSPEFQITTETSVVGSLNFFADLFNSEGYGDGRNRQALDLKPLAALAGDPAALSRPARPAVLRTADAAEHARPVDPTARGAARGLAR